MKILLTTPNSALNSSDFLRSRNVVYAPELHGAPAESLFAALDRQRATGLITERMPNKDLLQRWNGRVKGSKFISYVIGNHSRSTVEGVDEFRREDHSLESISKALRRSEYWFTLNNFSTERSDGGSRETRRSVILIGAGIVNLITGLRLTDNGYNVIFVDRSPKPGDGDWRRYGCTHSGDDARMFTLTEMDNYNNRDPLAETPQYFRSPIEKNGWLISDRQLSAEEEAWITEFEQIPSWLARAYNNDIFSFNSESYGGWAYLRHRHSELFRRVVLRDNVLRLYSDPVQLIGAIERHRKIGAVIREMTPAGIADDFPMLSRPMEDKSLAGGFLVPGFTLNVHKFSRKLIKYLESRGVSFLWNTPVSGVRRDTAGRIIGFNCPRPLPRHAHVVASPGIHGNELLKGSPCDSKIHGVLGGWMRISNDRIDLENSLKVSRKGHVTEDANVTVALDEDGRKVLIVGSGYGYVGSTPDDVSELQLAVMKQGILDTIQRLFVARSPLVASSRAAENYDFKYCVRPWTATSLGLYHAEIMEDGGLFIINGGHNTGGFAQAPAIADAILSSLRGEQHPMHRLYQPDRFTAFAEAHN